MHLRIFLITKKLARLKSAHFQNKVGKAIAYTPSEIERKTT